MSHKHHHKPQVPNTQAIVSSEPTPQTAQADLGDGRSIIDRIRIRAFEISKARNGGPGDERADWLQAERELRTQSERKV